ncbi:MAG TPA: sigma-70 family RNA polymerase sigma factor [Actinomycetota bacterium]|nr:sigma-70 family RNA polymerase sigma factor [Actinomycetota bacterium]
MYKENDAALAARLMARDDQSLREAIELYGGIVNGMARRILADATLAEEVAQDVFLALWRRPGVFDPDRGTLKAFLATLARNKAIDVVRREESARRTRDSLLGQPATAIGHHVARANLENRMEIDDALRRIPDSQREVITLAYFGGRTYREVAAELGIPEGTAKTRMRDGLKRLRAELTAPDRDAENE